MPHLTQQAVGMGALITSLGPSSRAIASAVRQFVADLQAIPLQQLRQDLNALQALYPSLGSAATATSIQTALTAAQVRPVVTRAVGATLDCVKHARPCLWQDQLGWVSQRELMRLGWRLYH